MEIEIFFINLYHSKRGNMSHPIWSNIFKNLKRSESETEIALKQVPVFEKLTRSELNPLVEALDTLQAIRKVEQKDLEEELHPKGWLEAANADGEFFDEYKVLIDDFYRIFDLGFTDYDMVPPKFNALLANSLGYNFLSQQSGSILEKFGLFDSFSSEQKQYNNTH